MPEAQPGQEQRMVTSEMCQAGREMPGAWGYSDGLLTDIYTAMHAARPTADLGDDGDLDARLRRTEKRKGYFAPNATAPVIENEYDALINPDGPEAADRLILYREAVVEARNAIDAACQVILGTWADEALAKIDVALGPNPVSASS